MVIMPTAPIVPLILRRAVVLVQQSVQVRSRVLQHVLDVQIQTEKLSTNTVKVLGDDKHNGSVQLGLNIKNGLEPGAGVQVAVGGGFVGVVVEEVVAGLGEVGLAFELLQAALLAGEAELVVVHQFRQVQFVFAAHVEAERGDFVATQFEYVW